MCSLPHGMFLLCMACCIIAVGLLSSVFREKGLYVFVLGSKGSLSMCVSVLLYAHIWIFLYTCVLLSFGRSGTGWVSLQPRMGGLYIAPCEYLNLPMCWVVCFWRLRACTSARLPWHCELNPLLSKQIAREFGKPREPHRNPLKPPKTHLLVVPLPCWQHIESSWSSDTGSQEGVLLLAQVAYSCPKFDNNLKSKREEHCFLS